MDVDFASPERDHATHAAADGTTPPHAAASNARPYTPLNGSADTPGSTTTPVDSTPNAAHQRPKQKRNKPTLSCEECVERKTKCDRGRPKCMSCMKRNSDCHYTQIANLIASSKTSDGAKARYVTKPSIKARKSISTPSNGGESDAQGVPESLLNSRPKELLRQKSQTGRTSSPYFASSLPFSRSTPSSIFGVGAQHPFSNYWTCAGGIAEVVGVLPSKEQSDMQVPSFTTHICQLLTVSSLIGKYFEVIDPVYPFIHRRTFFSNYERFWAQPTAIRNNAEADLLALHYAMYALGTQFMPFPTYAERTASAEFYASAANQALRIYSYLNRASLRSLAAMVLLTYFLMNDNHASDAYAWSGILLRQAYALRLHRDPDLIDLDISEVEKQTRRRVWQAVFFQDTFLTVLLKLPPTATHSDVQVDSLHGESSLRAGGFDVEISFQSRVENLMSIAVIAPPADATPVISPADLSDHLLSPAVDSSDVEYIRSMWKLGHLVQENISSPMSLSLPLVSSPRQKTSLVSSFRALYRSFPPELTNLDFSSLQAELSTNPRGVRQNLFLSSNFFHCLMILQASENADAGVECNVRGSLEAAHEAIWSFFKLVRFFEIDATVWWVFQHRAFEEALTIARLLSLAPPPVDGTNAANDALYAKCKTDVTSLIDLVKNSTRGNLDMQKSRLAALEAAFERCAV